MGHDSSETGDDNATGSSGGRDETGTEPETETDTETGGPASRCEADLDLSRVVGCAPGRDGGTFDPIVEWSFVAEDGLRGVVTSPLVGNLNDDNGDGVVDLCDTPDIVVVTRNPDVGPTHGGIVALDGATGAVHWASWEHAFNWSITPALGDIDADGEIEIVAWKANGGGGSSLVALEADGTTAWESELAVTGVVAWSSVELADLDNDGDVEIVTSRFIFDHEGANWTVLGSGIFYVNYPVLVDLDGDEDLEIISGQAAYHHDGTLLYPDLIDADGGVAGGYPSVADFDGDGQPEVLTQTHGVLWLQEADGAVAQTTTLGSYVTHNSVAVADFDGDGDPEIATADRPDFTFFEADLSELASFEVWADFEDEIGHELDVGTFAFDFFGTGTAQAIFRDNDHWQIATPEGGMDFGFTRTQLRSQNVPVVADVDNDGAAELVIVSDITQTEDPQYSVQVIGNAGDPWVPARRIWNQHGYHVTNIAEDGSIPSVEAPPWTVLNTWGAQAQVTELGELCLP